MRALFYSIGDLKSSISVFQIFADKPYSNLPLQHCRKHLQCRFCTISTVFTNENQLTLKPSDSGEILFTVDFALRLSGSFFFRIRSQDVFCRRQRVQSSQQMKSRLRAGDVTSCYGRESELAVQYRPRSEFGFWADWVVASEVTTRITATKY